MNKKILLAVLIGLLVGIGGTVVVGKTMKGSHRMSNGEHMSGEYKDMRGSMDGMMMALEGKTGDEFDQAFLAEMIVHHEGAIDMAEAARAQAGHTEIKELSEAIITAQTAEITQMKAWQESWYGAE